MLKSIPVHFYNRIFVQGLFTVTLFAVNSDGKMTESRNPDKKRKFKLINHLGVTKFYSNHFCLVKFSYHQILDTSDC